MARVRHLSLVSHGSPPDESTPKSQPELVQRFDVPRAMPPWEIEGEAEVRVLQRPLGDLRTLHIQGAGDLRVGIPGQYVARSFNQAAVTLSVEEERPVVVEFLRRGKVLRRSRPMTALATGDAQTLVFDLPTMQRERAVFDELAVVFPEHRSAVQLGSVALVYKPHRRWLPDPDQAPRPVEIDGDWRPALGLSSASR